MMTEFSQAHQNSNSSAYFPVDSPIADQSLSTAERLAATQAWFENKIAKLASSPSKEEAAQLVELAEQLRELIIDPESFFKDVDALIDFEQGGQRALQAIPSLAASANKKMHEILRDDGIEHSSPAIRAASIEALADKDCPQTQEMIGSIAFDHSEPDEVVIAATQALVTGSDPRRRELIKNAFLAEDELRCNAMIEVADKSEDRRGILRAALKFPTNSGLKLACQKLEQGDGFAAEKLHELLSASTTNDEQRISELAHALVRINPARAAEFFRPHLDISAADEHLTEVSLVALKSVLSETATPSPLAELKRDLKKLFKAPLVEGTAIRCLNALCADWDKESFKLCRSIVKNNGWPVIVDSGRVYTPAMRRGISLAATKLLAENVNSDQSSGIRKVLRDELPKLQGHRDLQPKVLEALVYDMGAGDLRAINKAREKNNLCEAALLFLEENFDGA